MEHNSDKISVHSAVRKLSAGVLELNPFYQRNDVWTLSQKQLLVDSIIIGIPIPSFYFNKVSDNKIDVVDGQQRLRAIRDFKNDEFRLGEDGAYSSKLYSELPESIKDSIDDYQLNITYLKNWSEDQNRRYVFTSSRWITFKCSRKKKSNFWYIQRCGKRTKPKRFF